MDAFKILGSLLGNNATSSGQGGNILGQLIGGLASRAQAGGTGGGVTDLLGGLMGGGAQAQAAPGLNPAGAAAAALSGFGSTFNTFKR